MRSRAHGLKTRATDHRIRLLGALEHIFGFAIGEFEFGERRIAAAEDEIELAAMDGEEILGLLGNFPSQRVEKFVQAGEDDFDLTVLSRPGGDFVEMPAGGSAAVVAQAEEDAHSSERAFHRGVEAGVEPL